MMYWKYIYIDNREEMIMSGWKLYISGNSVFRGDVASVLLYPLIKQYNLTTKIATPEIVQRNNKNILIAWSPMVIYLTDTVFAEDRVRSIVNEIELILWPISYSETFSTGCTILTRNVGCRYDLNIPIDPRTGVPYEKYLSLYRGEYGAGNIANNREIYGYNILKK